MTIDHVDYSRLPEHMRAGAEDYVERGYKPGSFLRAVLANDLVEAFGHADSTNLVAMHAWAQWLWNDAPSMSWGSTERVEQWIASKANSEADGMLDDPAIRQAIETGGVEGGEPLRRANAGLVGDEIGDFMRAPWDRASAGPGLDVERLAMAMGRSRQPVQKP